jgi:hypothetical protein
MVKTIAAIGFSVAVTLMSGCDQLSGKHEIVRAGNQTFILNKSSGEAKLIDGTSLVAIKSPETAQGDDQIKKAKVWPVQTIPQLNDIKLFIRTKYRDGSMLYVIVASPFQGVLEKEYNAGASAYAKQPTFLLDLYDADGFQTGDAVILKVRGATRVMNEKGEIDSLSWTGTQPMSLETYRATTTQNVRWASFAKE